MDDLPEAIVAIAAIFFMVFGVLFTVLGSFDATIVNACEKNGYWQTGQTRIICHKEVK